MKVTSVVVQTVETSGVANGSVHTAEVILGLWLGITEDTSWALVWLEDGDDGGGK